MANGHGGRRPGAGRKPTTETAIFREFKAARADLRDAALGYADEAIQTIGDLLRCDDSRVRLAAAKEILDRAYGRPTQYVEPQKGAFDDLSDAQLNAVLHALLADIDEQELIAS